MNAVPPLLIASKSRLAAFLPTLRLLRKEEWQSVYLDESTRIEWIMFPLWDYHGPGPNCLRRGNPTLDDLLSRIECATEDAEVAATAYYLANDLPSAKENYGPLIERLEMMERAPWSERQARNAALAVAWSAADRPFNHRDPLGKPMAEVNADYQHFSSLALRAGSLKERAEALLGCSISQKSTAFE